jgi:membrane-associated phospholipid phosphatase
LAVGWSTRARAFIAGRFDSKTYLGLHLTIGVIVAGLGVWLFGALIDAVLDKATVVRLDIASATWIHRHVTPTGLIAFSLITHLGDPITRIVLAILGGILLAVRRRPTILVGWVVAFIGGEIVQRILKHQVARTRPAYGAGYLNGDSFSFPSGHAMGSTIAFAMAVYILLLFWHPPRPWRGAVVILAIAAVTAIAISRVYLGVHYPSDVVGGVAAGAAWVALCISAIGIELHRGTATRRPG